MAQINETAIKRFMNLIMIGKWNWNDKKSKVDNECDMLTSWESATKNKDGGKRWLQTIDYT